MCVPQRQSALYFQNTSIMWFGKYPIVLTVVGLPNALLSKVSLCLISSVFHHFAQPRNIVISIYGYLLSISNHHLNVFFKRNRNVGFKLDNLSILTANKSNKSNRKGTKRQ